MTIAITGASGQFGRLVTDMLLQHSKPADLILISRNPDRLAAYAERGCAVRTGDFDDPAGLRSAFSGAGKLLLISGTRVGKRLPQHGGAIDAAKSAGVQHIVYTSFIGANNPDNRSEAVQDHRGTEKLLRESGLAWTALRNAQYADAVTDVMAFSMVHDSKMMSVAGDGRMPFVWREDCAIAAVAALLGEGHENQAYDITGPELVSYREVGQLIGEFTDQEVAIQLVDEAGLYAMFDAIGVPREPIENPGPDDVPWNSDDMVSFEVAVRDGHFAVDATDFERLTGSRPRTLRALFELKADDIAARMKAGAPA
ncbi:MAG: SDR family oxidoreductase [Novosphingobium sp.]|nr:SDR family oxidoreductase [Novosphingobium sp.]